MPFLPGDPWPPQYGGTLTPGGVAHPAWGGYIRFWLLVEIAEGNPFHLGAHTNDKLDAGNVMAASTPGVMTMPGTSQLWVDVTCDCIDVEMSAGSGPTAGILTKAEAGTLTATLYDPTGKYDPLNPNSPYALGGRTRLLPGCRVLAFAEIIMDPTAANPVARQRLLFSGTADSFQENWDREPGDRKCILRATDFTKNMVKLDRDEQPPVGANEAPWARLNRISDYFGIARPTQRVPSGITAANRPLLATTLAQSAWEMVNRTMDDELGYLYFLPNATTGALPGSGMVWYTRDWWTYNPPPTLQLGCGGAGFYDVVTDATPAAYDAGTINVVTAARAGGVSQVARNGTSVTRLGELSYNRTDLGLATDGFVALWAVDLVNLSAFPRATIDRMTMQPGIAPNSWQSWWDTTAVVPMNTARVVYESPRFDYVVDANVRMMGRTHKITVDGWELEWRTISADIGSGGSPFTMGAHAFDRLDSGNLMAV